MLIVENLKLGESFDKVRKVILISILYFPFSAGEADYLYHGKTEFYGLNDAKQLIVDMAKLPKSDKLPATSAAANGEIHKAVVGLLAH